MPKEMEGVDNEKMEQAPEPDEKIVQEKKQKKKADKEETVRIRAELEDTNDRLLRTLAEYDNFRKRSQKEREAIYIDSKAETLTRILPALDNFERARENTAASYEDYRKGIEMTVAELFEIIKGMGAEPFGEKGEGFDPNMHNAVMHIEDEDFGENEITDVFIKGYKMSDRILRPASVRVAN